MGFAFENYFSKVIVPFFANGELSTIDIIYYFGSSIKYEIGLQFFITQKSHKTT